MTSSFKSIQTHSGLCHLFMIPGTRSDFADYGQDHSAMVWAVCRAD